MSANLLNLVQQMQTPILGVVDDSFRLQLRLRHANLRFLVGVRLEFFGNQLGGQQGFLNRRFPLSHLVQRHLGAGQLLFQLLNLTVVTLQFLGELLQVVIDAALFVADEAGFELMLLNVDGSNGHGGLLSRGATADAESGAE